VAEQIDMQALLRDCARDLHEATRAASPSWLDGDVRHGFAAEAPAREYPG
jgi:hypothetical protein